MSYKESTHPSLIMFNIVSSVSSHTATRDLDGAFSGTQKTRMSICDVNCERSHVTESPDDWEVMKKNLAQLGHKVIYFC